MAASFLRVLGDASRVSVKVVELRRGGFSAICHAGTRAFQKDMLVLIDYHTASRI
jgi:hypothetical protein